MQPFSETVRETMKRSALRLRSRFPLLLFAGLALLVAAGCESIQELDRAAGELAKELKAQRAEAEKARREREVLVGTSGGCREISRSLRLASVDPDSAYVRLKHFFGFKSPSEAQKSYPYPEWLPYTNYRHETLPGVRYSMSENIIWSSSVYGRKRVWLTLDIEREGGGSLIRWSWCRGADGWETLGDPEKVNRALAKDIERVAGDGL